MVLPLRQALEEAPNFASAPRMLRDSPVASDLLLLATGVREGELAVIERTPSRAEVRWAEHGCVFVTNDFRLLRTERRPSESELAATFVRPVCARVGADVVTTASNGGAKLGVPG